MTKYFCSWKGKLFKFTHALILPLSILIMASIVLGISNIFLAYKIKNDLVLFFKLIGESIFNFLPILFGAAIVMYFTITNKIYAIFIYIFALVIFYCTQHAFIHYDDLDNPISIFYIHKNKYILYFITKNIGFNSLNTSFFGTFSLSIIVVYVMNNFSNFTFPKWFSIFNKERLSPFILTPIIILYTLLILIIWPYLGIFLSTIIIKLSTLKYGFDAFLYGIVTKTLKPFGFHYIFTNLILETSVGAVLNSKMLSEIGLKLNISNNELFVSMIKKLIDLHKSQEFELLGTKNIWEFVNDLSFDSLPINNNNQLIPIIEWFNKYLKIYFGKFTQDYATYFGLLLGISLAIIFGSPKNNRKKLFLIISPVMFIAFFTGITEPLEFILLFAAPLLYFLFYVPLSAFSLMFVHLFKVDISGNFVHGLIDFIVFGVIPYAKGTNFWIVFPITIFESFLSFAIFYLMFKKFSYKKIANTEYNAIFINKLEYKKMFDIHFEKQPNLKKYESLKQEINEYIINNIKTGKWKPNFQLPSEFSISIKFNCSRLTSRNVLKNLVSQGILKTIKGKGYFVTEYGYKGLFEPVNDFLNYSDISFNTIHHSEISLDLNWFKKINFNIDNLDLKKTYNFEKKYLTKARKLLSYELIILNKKEIFLDDVSQINQSLIKYFSLQGIKLDHKINGVVFVQNKRYQKIAENLGWYNECPIIITILSNSDDWIEISLKIINKESFQFYNKSKFIS